MILLRNLLRKIFGNEYRHLRVGLFCVKVNPATKNTDKYEYIKLCGFIQAQSIIKIFNMFIVTK
mgnify:FL=1